MYRTTIQSAISTTDVNEGIPVAEVQMPEILIATATLSASQNDVFHASSECFPLGSNSGISVKGDNENRDINATIIHTALPSIDIDNDDAYYAKFPPASSHYTTLNFFNLARSTDKSSVCVTNERPLIKEANHYNKVEVMSHPSSRLGNGLCYARKTSLFFVEPDRDIDLESSQLTLYQPPSL